VFLTSGADSTVVLSNLGAGAGIASPYDFNRDNNVTGADKSIAVGSLGSINRPNVPATPPVLTAALANDTGTAGDGITSNATIAGSLSGVNEIVAFTAGFDASPPSVDVFSQLQLNGTFTLSPAVLNTVFGGTLSNGLHTLHLRGTDAKGTIVNQDVTFTLDTVLPTISASTMMSFTDDLTPHVTVGASDNFALANGTQVRLDVDLNNDGDFNDAGETNRTLSTLYSGGSYFQLNPALPATDGLGQAYLTQIRVRVTDTAGNEGVSPLQSLLVDTVGNSILSDYVHANDPNTSYSLNKTIVGSGYTAYIYDLKSQTWRPGESSKPIWQHWVQVIVPTVLTNSTALLFVTGGSTSASAPASADSGMVAAALAAHSITVLLPTVPNQALTFAGDPLNESRTEDEIIAYSFDQYTQHQGDPGNDTWPALLAMAKSAVETMDMVQAVQPSVVDFIVSGASKRGWTTWLTAASDNRVKAIIPAVIDVLNMDEQMMHHYGFYDGVIANTTGGFSNAIDDYVYYGVAQNVQQDANRDLGKIVDPYSYINNGNLDIPKFLINSAGDEFFVPDSTQYYFSDLQGTQNYLRYIPNTGHSLNSSANDSLLLFYDAIANNKALPTYSWTIGQDGSINVQTPSSPTSVKLWQAYNSTARDFRYGYTGINYTSSTLPNLGGGTYSANIAAPATGAKAFFIELTFPSTMPGLNFIFTTEIRVVSNTPLGPWDFYTASNGGGGGGSAELSTGALASSDQNALVSGLAVGPAAEMLTVAPTAAAVPLAAVAAQEADQASDALFANWSEDSSEQSSEEEEIDVLELLLETLDV
jgi:PhoPQ-activated pathogenicity-related protein